MPEGMPNQTRRPVRLAEKIEKNLKGVETSSAMDRFHAIAKELAGIPWNHNEARRLVTMALIELSAALKEMKSSE